MTPSLTLRVSLTKTKISNKTDLLLEKEEQVTAPDLLIINVNLVGVLYTLKLAKHFFLKNPPGSNRDRCFIAFSSAAGYQDIPGGPMYQATKFAVRGLMRCTRRTTAIDGIRANALAPWYDPWMTCRY